MVGPRIPCSRSYYEGFRAFDAGLRDRLLSKPASPEESGSGWNKRRELLASVLMLFATLTMTTLVFSGN